MLAASSACSFIERAICENHTAWFCFSYDGIRAPRLSSIAAWYHAKPRQYYIDKHPQGLEVEDLLRRMWQTKWNKEALDMVENKVLSFPLVFVKQKCIGTYEAMMRLESERRLKDLLQFGMTWPEFSAKRPSAFGDEVAFRGIWRGHPPSGPIVPPPKFTSWSR